MSEMVARVAKAIAEVLTRDRNGMCLLIVDDADAEEMARAAMGAMRDPTREMLLAADVVDERSREMFPASEDSDAIPASAGAHWQTMIDEALK